MLGQSFAKHSAFTIFYVGCTQKIIEKYGYRGIRYIFIDAGHISQNFCLVASNEKVSSVNVGGFLDNDVSKELMLSENQIPIYVQCFGGNTNVYK